jgi:hypothetical protein
VRRGRRCGAFVAAYSRCAIPLIALDVVIIYAVSVLGAEALVLSGWSMHR